MVLSNVGYMDALDNMNRVALILLASISVQQMNCLVYEKYALLVYRQAHRGDLDLAST